VGTPLDVAEAVVELLGPWLGDGTVDMVGPDVGEDEAVAGAVCVTVLVAVALACALVGVGLATTTLAAAD
jgi:hypothetical protein